MDLYVCIDCHIPTSHLYSFVGGENRNVLIQYIRKVSDETNGNASFECSLCEFRSSVRINTINHIESKHFPGTFTYTCEFCMKTFLSKNSFSSHVSRNHK